ncbi:hypothetical protein JIX56_05770 [Streptomyces sp. CA-210063]|uniref:hypothetical protein n=1 Tax=Streptomyces sp. CA-210063 TaxID=2801029 RepID=UPI00214C4F0A|nr:hypothetical protein [Streptomyces sp. CA-210063]UUU29436.1 hypothetical protein JIX56_05770 [Streptomyces sp. CA-210063]
MKQYVTNTFGPLDDPASAAYFNSVRPHYYVEHNTRAIKAQGVKVPPPRRQRRLALRQG